MSSLKDQTRRLHIDTQVKFLGTVENQDLPGIFAQCDLFAFPSLEDTYAAVIAQALATGLPVITNVNVGPAYDLILDGYNGFTVNFADETAVAASIKTCLSNVEGYR